MLDARNFHLKKVCLYGIHIRVMRVVFGAASLLFHFRATRCSTSRCYGFGYDIDTSMALVGIRGTHVCTCMKTTISAENTFM